MSQVHSRRSPVGLGGLYMLYKEESMTRLGQKVRDKETSRE